MLVSASWIPPFLLLCTLTPGGSSDSVLDRATELPTTRASESPVPVELSREDWAGVRAAHAAARHAARPVEGGFQAYSPGQRWSTRFDDRGSLTEPDSGGWTWGLELESYGFAGSEQAVQGPQRVSAEGGRVAYEWDAILEEWYVNDSRGLEHGFTVRRRPVSGEEGGEDPLTFTLAVRGELHPVVDGDGAGVRFLDEEGAAALTYRGLRVFDAEGRVLEAGFERVGDRLRLGIDERSARYPLTIDPVAQQAYLKASNTGMHDAFGTSVSVSGDTVVIGAPGEDSSATGVNGNELDNGALSAGAAYVFVRDGIIWKQEAYLKASNAEELDLFAESVAVSGDTIVVGALYEDSSATGVNGDQNNNSRKSAGAAYVFVRSGTSWSQEAYLKASNAQANDWFGLAVAVSGNTIVVGADHESSNATGVNGDQSDNSVPSAGAAYVFVRSGTSWSQEAYLKASNPDPYDLFGRAVAISGDTIVVGARQEGSNATGVNGNQSNNSELTSGAAYVFRRSGTSWSQEAYLKASNTDWGDQFGYSVAVSGDTIVVSAPVEDGCATGVNGTGDGNGCFASGAAYLFHRSGSSWSQLAYLKASNTEGNDGFGCSVAVSGDKVVVGATGEASGAFGVDGDQLDNSVPSSGAAYVFIRAGATWEHRAYLKASNTDEEDWFGFSVAASGDTLVVSARGESSSATGVNGDQGDDGAQLSGAAYAFLREPGTIYCVGNPGSGIRCPCVNNNDGSLPGSGCANGVFASGARLSGSGIASISTDTLVLTTTHLEPNNFGLYFQADDPVGGGDGVQFGDGLRCADGQVVNLQVRLSDATGTSHTTIEIGAAGMVAPGDTRRYQCIYRTIRKPPCGLGVWDFNLSNGYEITWLP